VEGGRRRPEEGEPWNLRNTNPFSFHMAKASCAIRSLSGAG
jgi:hypothetical protein